MVAPKLNNASYRAFFESAAQGMLLVSEKGILLDANREACDALGYRREELSGMALRDLLDPACRDAIPPNGGFPAERRELELRFLRPDGGSVVVEALLAPCPDGNGARLMGIVFRRPSGGFESRAAQHLERFRVLAENAQDIIFRYRLEPTPGLEYISPSVTTMTGYTPEEHYADPRLGLEMIHPDDRYLIDEILRHPELPVTIRWLRKDGTIVWAELRNKLIYDEAGELVAVEGISRDVTERERADERLRRSEERFRSLVRYASDIVTVLDRGGRVLYESSAVERTLGYRPEERIGKHALECLHPDDIGWVERKLARVLEGDEERSTMWFRVRHKKGEWRFFEAVATNLLHHPAVEGIVLNTRDITELKRVQEKLEEAEERYRTLVEAIPAVTYIRQAGDGGTVRYLSPQVEAMTGYLPEDFYTDPPTLWYEIVHPDDRLRSLAEGHPIGEVLGMEYRLVRRDGRVIWVRNEAILVGDAEGRPRFWQGVMLDITERKLMEEDLRYSLDTMLTLYEASQILLSSPDLEEIGPRLLDMMRRVADFTAAVIELRDGQGEPRLLRATGPERTWRLARETPAACEARRAAIEAGHPRSFQPGPPGEPAGEDLPSTGLCLPLRVGDRPIGTVEAYGPASLAERKTVEVLGSLTGLAGSALENARLYGELAEREGRLEELLGKLIATQEEERRRVAYEVHDGFAHVAVAAHQRLQDFARRHLPASAEGEESLNRVLMLVQRAVREARRVIANLRPTALDDLGLAGAIRLEVEGLRGEGWHVDYEDDLGDERLPVAVETAVFRVAQEALTNARKHAQTRRARLELMKRDGKLCLSVEDRGRGFDPAALLGTAGPGERVGISGMRERVSLLGGSLEVRSRPGEGTAVVAEVPIPERTGEGG